MTLIEIGKAAPGQLPFAKITLYKFHSQKKHPNLVYKVSGKLFFDMDEWEAMAQRAKAEHIQESEKRRRGIE